MQHFKFVNSWFRFFDVTNMLFIILNYRKLNDEENEEFLEVDNRSPFHYICSI